MFDHTEDYGQVFTMAQMFLINRRTSGGINKVLEMYKEIKHVEKNDKFFKVEKN